MSLTEIALIFLVFIIFFGPEDLQQIARALGKAVRTVRNIKDEIMTELKRAVDLPEASLKSEAGGTEKYSSNADVYV